MNEAWVESLRSEPKHVVVDRFREITASRLATLRTMDDEQLSVIGPSPIGNVSYREFMDVRLMDCWSHEQDIRRAVALPGHHTGRIVGRAMDRFASAMPFLVARRVGAPDGAVFHFDLTGDGARQIWVAMEGRRARLIDDGQASERPLRDRVTCELTMAAETWCCLALGRWSGASVRDRALVSVSGDATLGNKLIDSMTFMI
jgi:uncharacterized protein (TIGR03083 family)